MSNTEHNSITTHQVANWIYRQRLPLTSPPHPLVLLLHGWTGDETVMWVFAARLPKAAWLVAPRGLFPALPGGYGWQPHRVGSWPAVDDFLPSVTALQAFLSVDNFPSADLAQIHLIGFSQGAALSFAFTHYYPQRVASIAALSGFMPSGILPPFTFAHIPVFWAHGSQDDLVPIERARGAVQALQEGELQVDYCEHDVGHKLNAACFSGLQAFYRDRLSL
jgi:phospholipase/carboxylesterase